VVEKREAQAQDLIATVRCSIHFRLRHAHVARWRFSLDIRTRVFLTATMRRNILGGAYIQFDRSETYKAA
jgi:hypothetical protein